MSEAVIDGADDWRSESEKRKSMLRKACIALFRTWIPDHPEASMARGEVFKEFRDAMAGYADQITLVSRLSTGVEDIHVYDFMPYQSISMQDLLVQREGTDAFLDPKNALRVVRRKFGMMTLVARMAGVFEQRNCNAIVLRAGIDEAGLLNLGKLMASRVEGTAVEEEQAFKKRLRKLKSPHVDAIYHSEFIGRRVPVGWTVKRIYTFLHRKTRRRRPDEGTVEVFAAEQMGALGARHLRQLAMYADDMAEELDLDGFDPFPWLARAADERLLLTATRSLFDEFRDLRAERDHERAVGTGEAEGAIEDAVAEAADGDFLAEAGDDDDDDELLRTAQALERIREARGLDFFRRISMVSGNVNFVDQAMGSGLEGVESQVAELDPVDGLRKARAITEPFYRARALSAVVGPLVEAERADDARRAADEALAAARKCSADEAVMAYAAAVVAGLGASAVEVAASGVREALGQAHATKDPDERAAALMRVVSTLMEAGPLPGVVRSALSAAILGDDVHFWDKKAVTSPLVEAILALMSGLDDDTIIFLRKVVSHPDVEVRRSVLRTVPIAESEPLRNMLVSHLKDPEPAVRIEVIERIGASGDRRLSSYIINHFRQGAAQGVDEKRALAINLARIDPSRFFPLFNAMLGPLGMKDARYTDKQKPLKDDADWQRAGLEVLFHLNDRESRRVLFHAGTKGKGKAKALAADVWPIIKSKPYGEPTLPRSPHDPDWTEADAIDLDGLIEAERARQAEASPAVEPAAEPEPTSAPDEAPSAGAEGEETGGTGLFGRLRRLFNRTAPTEERIGRSPRRARRSGTDAPPTPVPDQPLDTAGSRPADADEAAPQPMLERPLPPADGPPRAVLAFSAALEAEPTRAGPVPMAFTLYRSPDAPRALWRETRAVEVRDGRFEVELGAGEARLPALPEVVWLGVEVDGTDLGRAEVRRVRRVVQG